MVNGLQFHAGFHFTFALVELAVFQGNAEEDLVIVPRTLAKTYMIERGIIRIDDQRSEIIEAKREPKIKSVASRQSITSEQFYEAMAQRHPELPNSLKSFLEKLTQLGVYADYQRSLNLKWEPPIGKPINLGYVKRDGQLWTDAASWFIPDPELSETYINPYSSIAIWPPT